MKCKKIVAMIVALASFMAFATSGFAATITTTTTYNTGTDKANIAVNVTGIAAGTTQVTYLAKSTKSTNPENIIYIDQQPVVDDAVAFSYKVAKGLLEEPGTAAEVLFGADGNALAGVTPTGAVKIDNIEVTYDADAVTVENAKALIGVGETISLTLTPKPNYEVVSVKIGDTEKYDGSNLVIDGIKAGDTVVIKTQEVLAGEGYDKIVIESKPDATNPDETVSGTIADLNNDNAELDLSKFKAQTTIFKPTGNVSKISVRVPKADGKYDEYVAYSGISNGEAVATYQAGTYYAVRVLYPDGTDVTTTPWVE